MQPSNLGGFGSITILCKLKPKKLKRGVGRTLGAGLFSSPNSSTLMTAEILVQAQQKIGLHPDFQTFVFLE